MINTLLALASAAQTTSGVAGQTATSDGSMQVGATSTLAVDVNVSAVSGTTPTLNLFLERLGADRVWYAIWSPTQITAVGVASTSIGPGCATNAVLTDKIRMRWAIGGTSPSFTFSASIVARAVSGT